MSDTSEVYAEILESCDDKSTAGALVFEADLYPLEGEGAPVSPPTYPAAENGQGPRWQRCFRHHPPGSYAATHAKSAVGGVVLDRVASQAKRVQHALETTVDQSGMPLIVLDVTDVPLPVHLERRISNMRWPHRNADPYLRDAQLNGQPFVQHPVGEALIEATLQNAGALISWFPTAAGFGFWMSHLGKKKQQQKVARSWKSEIIGWNPAGGDNAQAQLGLKSDPLTLTKDAKIKRDERNLLAGWVMDEKGTAKPSEVGHGAVPFSEGDRQTLVPESFEWITQVSSASFPQMRCLRVSDVDDQNAAARALVACLLIHGHIAAFGHPFALRSGCGLRPAENSVHLDGVEIDTGAMGDGIELVQLAAQHADSVGVDLEGWNRSEPLTVVPSRSLRSLIVQTWPDLSQDMEAADGETV